MAATGADGVHVGQDDMAVADARAIVGTDRLVGLSTHSPEQIDAAAADVDYIGVGPVHATPTKPGRPAVGLELVRYAARQAIVPFFAIGGITPANVVGRARGGGRAHRGGPGPDRGTPIRRRSLGELRRAIDAADGVRVGAA